MGTRWLRGPLWDKPDEKGGEPEWAKSLNAKLDKLSDDLKKSPQTQTPEVKPPQVIPSPSKPDNVPPKQEGSSSTPQEKPEEKPPQKSAVDRFFDWLL